MKKWKYINKSLYEKRLSLGLDLIQACRLLGIYVWTLKLIEKGYIHVSKSKQKKFINAYKLEKDFFTTNLNVGVPTNKLNKSPLKLRSIVGKKWVKWTAIGVASASAAVTGFGVYCLNKKEINPKSKWSNDFSAFHESMMKTGDVTESWLYPGDTKYSVYSEDIIEGDTVRSSLSTYGNPSHAADTNVQNEFVAGKDSTTYDLVKKNTIINFNFLIYNKKKIVYSSFYNPDVGARYSVSYSTGIIDSNGTISLRPFTYFDNGTAKVAEINSEIYNTFSDLFNHYQKITSSHVNTILTKHELIYKDVNRLVSDIQTISRDNVLFLRMGMWFTSVFAGLGVIALFFLAYHFYVYYKHKKKSVYTSNAFYIEEKALLSNPKFLNDTKFPLFIPEFVVKIVGFTIALLSSLATIMIVYTLFEGTFWTFLDSLKAKNFTSNFLVAGVTLLFFISLDNNTQKRYNQLLSTIFKFLIIGIIFYIIELTLFYGFSTRGNIFSQLFSNFSNLLPGNFFWPLGLYALLYFILFTTPKSLGNDKKKIKKFRSLASIPTFLLIFNLIYQFAIKPYAYNVPYSINFLFYSKGVVLIGFLLIYIYSLFIYRMIISKRYGISFSNSVFFYTKRYYLTKNIIAVTAIAILTLYDLMFRFFMPNNSYGLGNNWALAVTIPFLLFYQPHIGNRNKAWDVTCTFVLNPLTSLGGIIGSIIEIIAFLDMENLFFIIS